MRDSKDDVEICLPKMDRWYLKIVLDRLNDADSEEIEQWFQNDNINFVEAYYILVIFSLGFIVGSYYSLIPITLCNVFFIVGFLFLLFCRLLYHSIMEFILFDERRLVFHTPMKIQSLDIGSIREVIVFIAPPDSSRHGIFLNRVTMKMMVIQKGDYKKLMFSVGVKRGNESEIVGQLSRYFKRHNIKFNSSSPQYYLELLDRKTLSDEEIESATVMIDEELSDPQSSDHVFKVKGLWHHKLKDYDEAAEWLEKYLHYHPGDREVQITLVESLEELTLYSKATTFTDEMFSQFPFYSEIIGIHGKMLFLAGRQEEGLGHIRSEIRRLRTIADSKRGLERKTRYNQEIYTLTQIEKNLVKSH